VRTRSSTGNDEIRVCATSRRFRLISVSRGYYTHVAAVSEPMTNTPASATNAVVECPAGTELVGGGIRMGSARCDSIVD
jgi:hypothetical protein